MKKPVFIVLWLTILLPWCLAAQETKSAFSVGTDIVSNYIWRGSKFGKGPAIQPTVEFTAGKFTLGAWGSYCLSDQEAPEADMYTSLSLGPVNLGLTDYYYPGNSFFNTAHHALEVNGSLGLGIFSFSGNWILNEGAGSTGNDLYFEAGFNTGKVNLFAGAGNGWYTPNGRFNVCNLGLSSAKDIKITESFSVPLTGSLILNPAAEQLYIVIGFSL
jgi:hypothetical protein